MGDKIEIAALWQQKSKAGKTYYSGKIKDDIDNIAGARIVMFKNENKKNEKAPDIKIYLANDLEQRKSGDEDIPF